MLEEQIEQIVMNQDKEKIICVRTQMKEAIQEDLI